jgi:hypothetical protein
MGARMNDKVFYLCDSGKNIHGCLAKHDGKSHMGSGYCGGECKHTSILYYAKNFTQKPTALELATRFEQKDGAYFEIEN